jgi:PhoPQ-activated pathogenicity-related protein
MFIKVLLGFLTLVATWSKPIRFTPENNVKNWPETQSLELFNYVAQKDLSFEYFDTGSMLNVDQTHGKWTGYLLNVTSQTWRSTEEVSIAKWTHTLAVIVPEQLIITDQALIYLTGGDNVPSDIIREDREDIILASTIAIQTQSIVGVMFQIPNQPIIFRTDPLQKQRHEDAVVGYTWLEFFRNTSRSEVLSHVPMTKAGVRGMDTLAHFCASRNIAQLRQFVVAGASKRGWTTWLVGAVDRRVKAVIPVVMDLLHLQTSLVHHYQSLGGWSFAFDDYYQLELTRYINTPLMSRMSQIIDPVTYISFLDLPKLVIGATGDEFFLLDDDQYWWGQLPGKTLRLMIPNAEHSLDTGILTVINGVSGFYYSITRDLSLPEITWNITRKTDQTILDVFTIPTPSLALIRQATTLKSDRRDFRLVTHKENCSFLVIEDKYCIQPVIWYVKGLTPASQMTYTLEKAKPYTGFLLEMTFPIQGSELYLVCTSQVVITPNRLPFDPPRNGELGKLV